MCFKNLLNTLNIYVSRRMFGITFLKHTVEPLWSSNFTLYLGKSLGLLLCLEPTHLEKLLKPHAESGQLLTIRKFKFSGETNFCSSLL